MCGSEGGRQAALGPHAGDYDSVTNSAHRAGRLPGFAHKPANSAPFFDLQRSVHAPNLANEDERRFQ